MHVLTEATTGLKPPPKIVLSSGKHNGLK